MAGLGLRLLGGIGEGIGDGMLAEAKARREKALADLKRSQDVEDDTRRFGQQKSLKQMDIDADKSTDLTPDEVAARGLPKGTFAQRGKGGKIDIVAGPAKNEDDVTIREVTVGDSIKYGRFDKKGNLLGYVDGAGGPRYRPNAEGAPITYQNDKGEIVYGRPADVIGKKPPPKEGLSADDRLIDRLERVNSKRVISEDDVTGEKTTTLQIDNAAMAKALRERGREDLADAYMVQSGPKLPASPLARNVATTKSDVGGAAASPPDSAVQYLKAHPDLASQFDSKYGVGASRRYLGQ